LSFVSSTFLVESDSILPELMNTHKIKEIYKQIYAVVH
jgi:hypothetical protein